MDLFCTITGTAIALQGLYYFGFIRGWKRHPEEVPDAPLPALSIVICARNEAKNLARNLPAVLEQDYPDFEVLVVDDGSTDDTPKTLEQLKDQYPRLKTLRISPEEKQGIGKKFALRKGVEAASGDMVLLTDADCRPASAVWAKKMALALGDKAIVLGVSPFETESGFTNGLAAYETATTAWQYIAYARSGSPYMGVGRNMGYKRSAFLARNWSAEELQLPSGDDDLFVQSEAGSGNTAVCTDPDAYTISAAPATMRDWYRQKKRHLATGHRYQPAHRILLGTFLLSKAVVYLGSWCCGNIVCSLSGLLLGASLILLANYRLHARSGLNPRWYLSPFFDIAYVFSVIFTGIASRLSPQRTWK